MSSPKGRMWNISFFNTRDAFGIHVLSVTLWLFCGLQEIRCQQTLDDSKQLLSDLLADYNKGLRPVDNQGLPLVLYVGFELVSIKEVDEITQTIKIIGIFALNWVDDSMKWDPSKYGYTYQLFTENDPFWTPTLILTSTTDKFKKFGDTWLGIRYTHVGVAYFYPGEVFEVSCSMDITFYPFDEHKCTLTFTPWGQTPEEIYIYNTSDKVSQTYFSPNGAWEFVDSTIYVVSIPGVSTTYMVDLVIRRLPRYIIINVIVPLVFLSLINLLVFFIPTDSGERISFCITLLLSIAVFLTIINDTLPKTSFPMSIFSYYLLAVLIISNCIVFGTIVSLNIYHTDESRPVPMVWKTLVRFMRCSCCRRRRKAEKSEVSQLNDNKIHPVTSIVETQLFSKGSQKRSNTKSSDQWQSKVKHHVPERDDSGHFEEEADIAWKDVSYAFDRLCFIFFFLSLVVATAAVFGIISQQNSDSSSED